MNMVLRMTRHFHWKKVVGSYLTSWTGSAYRVRVEGGSRVWWRVEQVHMATHCPALLTRFPHDGGRDAASAHWTNCVWGPNPKWIRLHCSQPGSHHLLSALQSTHTVKKEKDQINPPYKPMAKQSSRPAKSTRVLVKCLYLSYVQLMLNI